MLRPDLRVTTEHARTHDGAAYTRFRVQGATEQEVRTVLERAELSDFAGGSSLKVGDKPGRYAFNPLGGPPGTLRDLDRMDDGTLQLTLRGPIHGGGKVRLSTDPATGDVLIEELGVSYRPDLRFVPMAGQAEALFEMLPVLGGLARGVRELVEKEMGAPLAALHVSKAESGEIARNLEAGLRKHLR
jgi:hypothetical protein